MSRKNEASLKSQCIQQLSVNDVFDFTFNRRSFYRDYKLLHAKDEDKVDERVGRVVSFMDADELSEEIKLCFSAAILTPSRQTYYFNLFVIDLIERYYSDAIYYSKKREIRAEHLITQDDFAPISFKWVLYSGVLSPYQRYLLFEYLALGYSLEDLARRRYCTSRTIQTHLNQIIEVLDS